MVSASANGLSQPYQPVSSQPAAASSPAALGNCVPNVGMIGPITVPPFPSLDGFCPPGFSFQSYSTPSIPNPVAPFQTAAQTGKDALTLAGKIWSTLTNANFWKGIGLLVAGGIAVIVGVILWSGKGSTTITMARKAAESEAEA